MRKLLLTLLMALLVPALVSCESPEKAGYHGYLYFAQGSYLVRFSLRDGSLSVIANLGDKTIRSLSKFRKDKLLIAETASVNRREVQRISWIDVKTGRSQALYSGVVARHLGNSDIIVYDDGLKLYAVSLDLGSGADLEVLSHRQHQLTSIIEASDDIVLFETSEDGQAVISSYNAITGELKVLDTLSSVCRLSGAVWIDTLGKLACKAGTNPDKNASYVFVDLDGEVGAKLALPEGKQFLALAYVSDQNALILKESRRSIFGDQQKSAVWVHNIQSDENHRLSKNQNLGSSVVYTDF